MFAGLVQASDLELRVLPGDPVALTRARTAAPDPAAAHSVFADYLDRLGDGIVDAATAGTDLLITAFGPAPLARAVAEGLGIPSVGAYLAPGFPTTAFPPPGLPNADNLGPRGNLAAGREMFGRAASMYAAVVHRLRAGLGGSAAMPDGGRESDGWPIFHGFSPTVVPRPDDWPAHVRVSGYWWPAPQDGWQPAAEVADFLAAGPPPVFVGFGSMTPSDGEALADLVAASVRRAGVRAIVQAGWAAWSLLPTTSAPLVTCRTTGSFRALRPSCTMRGRGRRRQGCVPACLRLRCRSWSIRRSGRRGCINSAPHRRRSPAASCPPLAWPTRYEFVSMTPSIARVRAISPTESAKRTAAQI